MVLQFNADKIKENNEKALSLRKQISAATIQRNKSRVQVAVATRELRQSIRKVTRCAVGNRRYKKKIAKAQAKVVTLKAKLVKLNAQLKKNPKLTTLAPQIAELQKKVAAKKELLKKFNAKVSKCNQTVVSSAG